MEIPKPTIANSNTKFGAMLSFVMTALILFLPEFGIDLDQTLIEKILWLGNALGGLITLFGFRNAMFKNLKAFEERSINSNGSN